MEPENRWVVEENCRKHGEGPWYDCSLTPSIPASHSLALVHEKSGDIGTGTAELIPGLQHNISKTQKHVKNTSKRLSSYLEE